MFAKRCAVLSLAIGLILCGSVYAQNGESVWDTVDWQDGPYTGQIGSHAQIEISRDYTFLNARDTQLILRDMGNPTDGDELASVFHIDEGWFIVFAWDSCGYVKDEDRDDLDADDMMDTIREGSEIGNKERREMGYPTLDVDGWEKEPFYDQVTNNLTWAIRYIDEGGEPVVNFNTKWLGRRGVMTVILVADPEELPSAEPAFSELMKGFSYTTGNKYNEFSAGDKIAKYGLGALIVGGGAAAAYKLGFLVFLKKGWKLIVGALAAIGYGIKRIFGGSQ